MNELYEFILLVVKTIFTAMLPLLILLIAFLLTNLVVLIVRIRLYKSSEYYAATKIPYLRMKNDTGKSGEYQTYKKLKSLGGNRKFLFNCYLPVKDEYTRKDFESFLLTVKTKKYDYFCDQTRNHGKKYGAIYLSKYEKDGYYTINMYQARNPKYNGYY